MSHQLNLNFFGPVQGQGALIDTGMAEYKFMGNCLSASLQTLWLEHGFNRVKFARWVNKITPNGNTIRLIHCDGGPTNIVQIAERTSSLATPTNLTAGVTDEINALINAGIPKQIGFQVKGDGITTFTLYESTLELVFA
jgi:hypothetical protein